MPILMVYSTGREKVGLERVVCDRGVKDWYVEAFWWNCRDIFRGLEGENA